MLLVRVELHHVAWQPVLRRSQAVCAQPLEGFRAQVFDPVLRHGLEDVAERLERPRAGEKQVAAHEVGEAKVGIVGDEASTRFSAASGWFASTASNTAERRSSGVAAATAKDANARKRSARRFTCRPSLP